jgi:hypothetical protein
MAKIYIKCPKTGKDTFTGMDAPDLTSNVFSNNSVSCPHCGGMHTWSNADGYFID